MIKTGKKPCCKNVYPSNAEFIHKFAKKASSLKNHTKANKKFAWLKEDDSFKIPVSKFRKESAEEQDIVDMLNCNCNCIKDNQQCSRKMIPKN